MLLAPDNPHKAEKIYDSQDVEAAGVLTYILKIRRKMNSGSASALGGVGRNDRNENKSKKISVPIHSPAYP